MSLEFGLADAQSTLIAGIGNQVEQADQCRTIPSNISTTAAAIPFSPAHQQPQATPPKGIRSTGEKLQATKSGIRGYVCLERSCPAAVVVQLSVVFSVVVDLDPARA